MSTSLDSEFVSASVLEILIPQASDRDIEEILQTAEDTDANVLVSSIPQRQLLFFDESLPVYAVLRTNFNNERALKDCLSRITIGLEAHAVSSPNASDKDRTSAGSQVRDIIWTGKVNVTEDPTTVVIGSETENQTVFLVWKTIVILARPRMRLQSPAVLFKVSASLQPALVQSVKETDPYLPSGVPLPSNILQPLGADAALKNVLPGLSALQSSRNASRDSSIIQDALPLKVAARRACRAVPALSSRIRVQKAPFSVGNPSMIGSLEIDVPPFAQYPLQITAVNVSLPQGSVQEISAGMIPKFPMTVKARDQVVSLYTLTQDAKASEQGQGVQTLEVAISVSVQVSDECHPTVLVKFKANIDFLGSGASQGGKQGSSSQRSNRPSDSLVSTVKPGDQFIDTTSDGQSSTAQEKLGIVVKFTAKSTVYVGEPFRWDVFVMNRSGRQRRLGLSMLHKRKTGGEKRISSRPTSISGGRQLRFESIAESFTDDNLLYTMIKSYNRDQTQLLCLNTDVKIGPLNPGSCFSTEMEFLPLSEGSLHIEAIRLTDYTTNEAVDIRDLPDIFAINPRQKV